MPSNLKPNTARSGVFISYARSDGEKFANALRGRLKKEGIPLWQDRVGMEGGRDWWLQITEALDQVEFMALVITPNALKSDTVRKEWRYARQQGVCVYPIKGAPDLDFDSLPRWMRSAHFYDLGTIENGLKGPEWQKFTNDLNTTCQTKRVPFMVEDLPEGFVQRPGEFDQLLKLLIDERREEPVAITAALRGAGGYGKTTLAKALCHDERIQDAFDDGIIWITLGENPGDLTGRVEDLIVTLGDERPNFTALDAAVYRLKELLADRDILIVIDDVWDRAHLNPFIQGGPRCARLITTRNFDTVPVGAARVRVDAMQQDEATSLLAAGLDETLLNDRTLRRELRELASRLGEWPLLLRLVNSALRNRIENDKQSPHDAITWVNKALTKRGLAYFDAHNSEARHEAVVRTIGVSLDLLSASDRERYAELAIFPEDVEIPLATLEKLWRKTGGFDEFDTEELCSRLNRFSLLWSYDADRRRIRLHDVVRKFLIDSQTNKLLSVHAQLLDVHRLTTWAEMPANEPYLWEYLAYHLAEAGLVEELVATVKDWRYLVAKTLIRKSLAVESDLLVAGTIKTDDDVLRLLRRNFTNSSHILNQCQTIDEIEVTLFSRLQHLDNLNFITTDLRRHLKRPFLEPASNLPDLPHPALVRTLTGHSAWVWGCAMTADESTIVSASRDGRVKVWDRKSGAERFTLSGHSNYVNDCAVSADAATIVSASTDTTLKVWDGPSGIERFTLSGHTGPVNACAVTADGTTIVSASDDGTLKVWDGRDGTERITLSGHTGPVKGCAMTADGMTIISASDDTTLKVWDGKTGAERFTLTGHTNRLNDCAVSSGGEIIVSASLDWTVRVWDGQTGTKLHTLRGHHGAVYGCAISADMSTIISGSYDQTLKVWDWKTGVERFVLTGHAGWVTACAVSTDGRTIVSASIDDTLKVWDGSEYRSEAAYSASNRHSDWVKACAVSSDGTTIVTASDDRTLKVWDGPGGTDRLTLRGHFDWVVGCAVTPDGATIVSASDDRTLKVWDGRSGVERFTLTGHEADVNCCAVSADCVTIVSASDDQMIKVWDGRNGTERFTLSKHEGPLRGCALSADGTTIVAASDDTLTVWDGHTGIERLSIKGHWVMSSCAISTDGGVIVSASWDRSLKVWDGRTGAERYTLTGHSEAVRACTLSYDGSLAISASEDQTLRVWNTNTGQCLTILHVGGPLFGCACSADGKIVVGVGPGGIYFLGLVR